MTFTIALDAPPAGTPEQVTALIGGKATGLVVMAHELGLPVPPAFAITTETCRAFLASGWPDGLDDELRVRMAALETTVGRRFGDPSDPLLVSVRSGAPVSMPGMMDTILNLGITERTAAGLARSGAGVDFARDCQARFVASFREIVGVPDIPEDPWQQLRLAIEAVFRSWNSDRARAYRSREGIADDLGTAVTVQAMVFGNRGATSATGVLFTRDPATGANLPYGDVLFDAQGEDVVAGTHRTEPIAILDERLPEVATQLHDIAGRLERHYADVCDIEFTIEDGRLWMLQTRVGKRGPQAALRIAVDMAEDASFPLSRAQAIERVAAVLADPPLVANAATGGDTTDPGRSAVPIATGLAASPGIASGEIVTSPDAAVAAAEAGRAVILVRTDTTPDDVHGMARAAGILTARGGLASHAAVVARGWGIPAVVGAAGIRIEGAGQVVFGDRVLAEGDLISIDGGTGRVFAGAIDAETAIAPEAQTLLGWAAELGIEIGGGDARPAVEGKTRNATTAGVVARNATGPAPPSASADRLVTPDACLRIIAIKGFATTQAIADAAGSTPDDVQPIVDALVGDRLVTTSAGALRLTESGAARGAEILAAEQSAWGVEPAAAALDAFHQLDLRMKAIVTAWQLRDDRESQVINDHADPEYDRGILDRLAAVHDAATTWAAVLDAADPRLRTYPVRLGRALEAARAGDHRYVASPRVDSYHGIWFELHEDLIQLAGRTREDEVAAGRA